MLKGFFFKKSPYKRGVYLYRNFYVKDVEGSGSSLFYPISVIFSNNYINFLYTSLSNGETITILKIDLSTDEINKERAIKRFESYWHFGSLPLSKLESEEKYQTGYINPFLVEKGFYSDLFQFTVNFSSRNIKRYSYFQSNRNSEYNIKILNAEKKIKFYLGEREIDEWTISKSNKFDIKSHNINLILLALDFFYELVYARTFDDIIATTSMDKITGNPLFVALISKLEYLDSLYKIRNKNIRSGKDLERYKDFLQKEREWLNILLDDKFYPLFISSKSLFLNIEDELSNVLFNSRIGKFKKARSQLLSKERKHSGEVSSHIDRYYDQHIISEVSGFFLRRFNIKDAFRTIFPKLKGYTHFFAMFLLFLGAFGDWLFKSTIFYVAVPALIFIFILVRYIWDRINMFKLFLPRLFLGILIGWLSFAMTADLWKNYIIKSWSKILVLDVVLAAVIFFFVFTSIRNRLKRLSDTEIFKRSIFLILFASTISLFQGFYITQLEAKEMLSVSGFFKDIKESNKHKTVCNLDFLGDDDCKDTTCEYLETTLDKNLKIECVGEENVKLCYIWNVLLSQFLVAMLIGIVLQLLWEDRPITEPL